MQDIAASCSIPGIRASLDPLPSSEMEISTARETPGKSKTSKAHSQTAVHHALLRHWKQPVVL